MTKDYKQLEKTLNKLYEAIFEDKHKASKEELQEANKTVLLYNCGRFNLIQVCFRLTLIYNHLIDLIYNNDNVKMCCDTLQQ